MSETTEMLWYGERQAKNPKGGFFRFFQKNAQDDFLKVLHHGALSGITMCWRNSLDHDLAYKVLDQTRRSVGMLLVVGNEVTKSKAFVELIANPRVDYAFYDSTFEELRERLQVLLKKIENTQRVSRLPGQMAVTRELNDPESGRLDASKVAAMLGLSLRKFSALLGQHNQTVHQTPDSERLQEKLRVFERIGRGLSLVDDDKAFRAWLRTSNPELSGKAPLDLILKGRGEVVANLVENALLGQPS